MKLSTKVRFAYQWFNFALPNKYTPTDFIGKIYDKKIIKTILRQTPTLWKLATHGKHIERDVPKLGGHIGPPPLSSSSTSSSSLVSSVVQDAFV